MNPSQHQLRYSLDLLRKMNLGHLSVDKGLLVIYLRIENNG